MSGRGENKPEQLTFIKLQNNSTCIIHHTRKEEVDPLHFPHGFQAHCFRQVYCLHRNWLCKPFRTQTKSGTLATNGFHTSALKVCRSIWPCVRTWQWVKTGRLKGETNADISYSRRQISFWVDECETVKPYFSCFVFISDDVYLPLLRDSRHNAVETQGLVLRRAHR